MRKFDIKISKKKIFFIPQEYDFFFLNKRNKCKNTILLNLILASQIHQLKDWLGKRRRKICSKT